MQTMVKMSEVISMDMSLEQLLDTMMKMIIENSGAQKGIFALSELGEGLLVVAEGDLDSMQVRHVNHHHFPCHDDLYLPVTTC